MKIAYLCLFLLSQLAPQLPAEEAPPFPYYIRVLQKYTYSGTSLTSSAGEVEQVIAEAGDYLILSSPTGSAVQLPKNLAQRITAETAAAALITERAQYQAEMAQIIAFISQNRSNSTGISDLTEFMRQMQEMEELSRPDKRRIPNNNRYEIHVK